LRNISWTEFKKTSMDKIRQRESVRVLGDGDEIFIAIIGSEGDMARTIETHAGIIQAGKRAESWEA
jgi:hypothetical protein